MMKDNSIPDIMLERYALGELPDGEIRRIRRLINKDESLKRRLRRIEDSNREILEIYHPREMARDIESIAGNGNDTRGYEGFSWQRLMKLFIGPSLAFATLAVVLFVVLSGDNTIPEATPEVPEVSVTSPPSQSDKGIRIKGERATLFIYRKRDGEVERLEDGAIARQGDILQIAYRSVSYDHGVIFSVDGRGVVTLHYPPSRDASTKLATGKKRYLPESYELDDSPRYEHFIMIVSRDAVEVKDLMRRIRRRAGGTDSPPEIEGMLPDTMKLYTLTVRKE